jgi:hypothetical protein
MPFTRFQTYNAQLPVTQKITDMALGHADR